MTASEVPASVDAEAAATSRPPRTVRILLEYDGAAFAGWQRQDALRTVQGDVERVLERLLGARTPVAGAGRTDAGVHARGMVASFATSSEMPAARLHRALDALLPQDVGVLAVADAPPGFHALRDARWKWYRYTFLRSRIRRVPWRGSAWRVVAPLDLGAMEAAAAACRGRLDFAAFQSSGSPRRSTVRTMFGLRWEEEGPLLHLDAVADGFLYGMVRCMAGTFVEVGRRARAPETVSTLLASRDRRLAGASAPAHGLCLLAVGYAGDRPPPFVDPALAAPVESGRPRPRDLPEASGDLRTCGS